MGSKKSKPVAAKPVAVPENDVLMQLCETLTKEPELAKCRMYFTFKYDNGFLWAVVNKGKSGVYMFFELKISTNLISLMTNLDDFKQYNICPMDHKKRRYGCEIDIKDYTELVNFFKTLISRNTHKPVDDPPKYDPNAAFDHSKLEHLVPAPSAPAAPAYA